ncbi:MAG: ComF family protein [Candidatus Omnitrophota bacterium]
MLRGLLRGLKEILFPKACSSCKKKLNESDEELICKECYLGIKINLPPFCVSCGRHLEKNNFNKNICPGCAGKRLYFDRAFSACIYEGIATKLIHEFKYRGKESLAKPLSKIMINFIREYSLPIESFDFIIPIPLHKIKLREREFNQAEKLSSYIAKEFNKKVSSDILLRRRNTKAQAGLKDKERKLNVAGSFTVAKNSNLKNSNLLLIDDVLTTGATASEAALVLKNAGAQAVFVLTLAN